MMLDNRRDLLAATSHRAIEPVELGLGFRLGLGAGGASGPAPLLSSIDAAGWSAQYATTPPTFAPDVTPITISASRQGYDATGATTTYTEDFTFTQRVRQAYPSQASLTTNTVALQDYAYSTDTFTGVTNNSAETSPKPIANWIMPHRQTVGNTVRLEVLAAHRNARAGKQVACVKFIATDGVLTVSQIVSATVVSGRAGDKQPVVCHQCDLDISTLATGLITVNAEVYPWIGAAASVMKSADSAVAREFSPRYFLKNTTLAASPPYAYVSSGGNDGTGVVSTTAATAAATPFLTVVGAINGIQTALGKVDGAIIRIGSGGFAGGSPVSNRTQNIACLTIERDPAVTRANAVISFGAAVFRPKLATGFTAPVATGCVRFHDCTVLRTGTSTIQGEAANHLEIQFDDVDYDNGSNNAVWLSNSHDYWYGGTIINSGTASGLSAGTLEHRIFRGISADENSAAGTEGWLIVGSSFDRPIHQTRGTRSFSGGMIAFNKFLSQASATQGVISLASDQDVTGYAVLQNVFERTGTGNQTLIKVSADSATGNTSHIVIHNNTFAGFDFYGRANLFYDEGATRRTHKLMSCKGNIHVQINSKSDIYRGAVQGGGDASSATGNWAYMYGVGCQGEFSQFVDAGPNQASFRQSYPGLGASIGTSSSVRNDPLFTAYAGVTSGPTVGAGGGTYSVGSSSPCKSRVASAVLSDDFAATVRPTTNDTTGAYVAP